jgi:hypothetical protein
MKPFDDKAGITLGSPTNNDEVRFLAAAVADQRLGDVAAAF